MDCEIDVIDDPKKLLEVIDLHLSFKTFTSTVHALRGISLKIFPSEIVGIVGESGSGKSALAHCIMRLHQLSSIMMQKGQIFFEGEDLLLKSKNEMGKIRGKKMGMIFQDPMNSLNPTMRIGSQIAEALRRHLPLSKKEAYTQTLTLLNLVGISNPDERIYQYPHELSGGMRQRVVIAIALALKPKLLIADEPTTALDVTLQAQILELMKELQKKLDTSILFITHDLGIVAKFCDRVLVMYGGQIVEEATTQQLFSHPAHPYTQGLLRSYPRIDMDRSKKLIPIEGSPPNLHQLPTGCSFCPRCDHAEKICSTKTPPRQLLEASHAFKCWKDPHDIS